MRPAGPRSGFGRGLAQIRRGRCLHRPGNLVLPQTPSGGRKRPPYIAAGNGIRRENGSQPPDPTAGRCNHRPLRGGAALHDRHPLPCLPSPGYASRLPYIVGRAFTPAGGLAPARKDIGKARHRTLPSSPTRCHFPLQGRLYSRQSLKSLPCKGRWMRRKAQTEGCIAALRRRYPVEPGRTLPCDDLRAKSRHFVLCAPKRRLRAAVLASSRKPCAAANPKRRAKTPALHCGRERDTARKRQPTTIPLGGPMRSSARAKGTSHKAQPCKRPAAPPLPHMPQAREPPYFLIASSRPRGMVQPFSFRNCSINATSLSTPSGGMAL